MTWKSADGLGSQRRKELLEKRPSLKRNTYAHTHTQKHLKHTRTKHIHTLSTHIQHMHAGQMDNHTATVLTCIALLCCVLISCGFSPFSFSSSSTFPFSSFPPRSFAFDPARTTPLLATSLPALSTTIARRGRGEDRIVTRGRGRSREGVGRVLSHKSSRSSFSTLSRAALTGIAPPPPKQQKQQQPIEHVTSSSEFHSKVIEASKVSL